MSFFCAKELEKHVVKVDMWRVSCWTFNEYYGVKKQKLSQIANRDPNMELRILRKLSRSLFAKTMGKKHEKIDAHKDVWAVWSFVHFPTNLTISHLVASSSKKWLPTSWLRYSHLERILHWGKQMADKKKAKSVADVALYRCTVNLEEIFDFDLFCALVRLWNWIHSVFACFAGFSSWIPWLREPIHWAFIRIQGENWTLDLSRANPEHKQMKEERKRLTFTVPRDRLSGSVARVCHCLTGYFRMISLQSKNCVTWCKSTTRFLTLSVHYQQVPLHCGVEVEGCVDLLLPSISRWRLW